MKIIRVINNNVVSCTDDAGREVIAMGRGLGFGAKSGHRLEETQAEKVFRMETQRETDRMKDMLASLPPEHIEVTTRIITYAKETLNKRLNQNVYLTLTDHISFAISRLQQGMTFQNALLTEVKTFYPREFAVGKHALQLVSQELHVNLPEDEAASIALHIVNAQYDNSLSQTMRVTQALQDILTLLDDCGELSIQRNSLYFDELIIHLKLLALRAFSGEEETGYDDKFVDFIRKSYDREYRCAGKVISYLEEQSHHPMSLEKQAYLAMNIRRIHKNESTEKEG